MSRRNTAYSLLTIKKLTSIILLFILSSCAKQESHQHDNDLSGVWEFHNVTYDYQAQKFVDTHVHVKITDAGNHVFLDHCRHDKAMTFTREDTILTNGNGESLQILHKDKITSLSVPTVTHLVKSEVTHDIQNAGAITITSEAFPPINLNNNVCAQRTIIENNETIILHLTLPFQETYMNMTLKIADINQTQNNLISGTLQSPNFMAQYGLETIQALSGTIKFLELSESKAKFEFHIELQGRYSSFVVDRFDGAADVNL